MYSKIFTWYKIGVWTIEKVREAVKHGVITAEEFKKITGKDYSE